MNAHLPGLLPQPFHPSGGSNAVQKGIPLRSAHGTLWGEEAGSESAGRRTETGYEAVPTGVSGHEAAKLPWPRVRGRTKSAFRKSSSHRCPDWELGIPTGSFRPAFSTGSSSKPSCKFCYRHSTRPSRKAATGFDRVNHDILMGRPGPSLPGSRNPAAWGGGGMA